MSKYELIEFLKQNFLFVSTHFEIGKDTSIDDIENKFEEATPPETGYNYHIPNYPLTFFTRRIPIPATQGINRMNCCNDESSISKNDVYNLNSNCI